MIHDLRGKGLTGKKLFFALNEGDNKEVRISNYSLIAIKMGAEIKEDSNDADIIVKDEETDVNGGFGTDFKDPQWLVKCWFFLKTNN